LLGIMKSGCPFVLNLDEIDDEYTDCAKFNAEALKTIQTDYANVPVFMISKTAAYMDSNNMPADKPLNIAGLDEVRNENNKELTPEQTNAQTDGVMDTAAEQFASGTSEFRLNYLKTVCSVAQTHPVWIANPLPQMPISVPKHLARKLFLTKRGGDVFISRKEYDQQSKQVYKLSQSAASACNAMVLNPADQLCTEFFCMGSKDSRPLYFDDNHLSEYGNRLLVPLFTSIEYDQSSVRPN